MQQNRKKPVDGFQLPDRFLCIIERLESLSNLLIADVSPFVATGVK
jgi:hypothetical protein